ncbi:hypothetical protein ACLMJK_001451 [Lecanora helva]
MSQSFHKRSGEGKRAYNQRTDDTKGTRIHSATSRVTHQNHQPRYTPPTNPPLHQHGGCCSSKQESPEANTGPAPVELSNVSQGNNGAGNNGASSHAGNNNGASNNNNNGGNHNSGGDNSARASSTALGVDIHWHCCQCYHISGPSEQKPDTCWAGGCGHGMGGCRVCYMVI